VNITKRKTAGEREQQQQQQQQQHLDEPRATIEHATDDVGAVTVCRWGKEHASRIAQSWWVLWSKEKRIRRRRRRGSDDVESGRGFGVR